MLRTKIEHAGQPYVDEPQYRRMLPKREYRTQIAFEIAALLQTQLPKPVEIITHYNRIKLNWRKPNAEEIKRLVVQAEMEQANAA